MAQPLCTPSTNFRLLKIKLFSPLKAGLQFFIMGWNLFAKMAPHVLLVDKEDMKQSLKIKSTHVTSVTTNINAIWWCSHTLRNTITICIFEIHQMAIFWKISIKYTLQIVISTFCLFQEWEVALVSRANFPIDKITTKLQVTRRAGHKRKEKL